MSNFVHHRRLCAPFVMLAICVIVLPTPACADDLDQQLLESLQEEGPPDTVATIVGRLLDNTARAQSRLAESQVDDVTKSVQQQILDDIDALLQQTSSPLNSPPPSTGEQQSPPADQSSSESQQTEGDGAEQTPSEGETTPDPDAASRESAERTSQASRTSAEDERRLGLATAVWGHLPPKVREQMRSAFSETYLPEYDDLVRRYYEALAARRARHQRSGNE